MSEYFQKACPRCRSVLRVRRIYIGRRVACKNCSDVFTLTDDDEITDAAAEHLAALTAECEQLRGQLAEVSAASQSLTAECERLRAEVARLERERDDARAESSGRSEALQGAQRLTSESAERAEALQKRLDDAQTVWDGLQRSHAESLDALHVEFGRQRALWDSERDALAGLLRGAEENAGADSGRVRELSDEVDRLTRDASEAASRELALTLERDAQNGLIADLESQMNDARQFREQMRGLLLGLGIRVPE